MNALVATSEPALSPATSSATTTVITTVTSRTRKPTVPAVPGSMRRKNVGPAIRPMSRAIAQPNPSSATTAAIWITVTKVLPGWTPNQLR